MYRNTMNSLSVVPCPGSVLTTNVARKREGGLSLKMLGNWAVLVVVFHGWDTFTLILLAVDNLSAFKLDTRKTKSP